MSQNTNAPHFTTDADTAALNAELTDVFAGVLCDGPRTKSNSPTMEVVKTIATCATISLIGVAIVSGVQMLADSLVGGE